MTNDHLFARKHESMHQHVRAPEITLLQTLSLRSNRTDHNRSSRHPPLVSSSPLLTQSPHKAKPRPRHHFKPKPSDSSMTTQPAPSSIMVTKSLLLYGILVSEKSFRVGMRSLAIQHQGHYLAHRIIGDRLPAELCDKIGAELRVLLEKGAARVWKEMKHDPEARATKFRINKTNPTESELVGRRKYTLKSACETAEGTVKVNAVPVHVDLLGAAEGREQRYVHLSAALIRPSIGMLVPNLAKHSGGPSLSLANGRMSMSNYPDGGEIPSSECTAVGLRTGEPGRAKRLVQIDDVEASIRTWNQKLIESLVSGMGLRAVDVSGIEGTGGGMKPELRILQELEWS